MNALGLLFLFLSLLVLTAFFWALARKPGDARTAPPEGLASARSPEQRSVMYWPQVRQALAVHDFQYVKERAPGCAGRMSKERRAVAFKYLAELKADFQQMLQLATAIAVLSPNVTAVHEWERLKLTARFLMQYRAVQLRLVFRTGSVASLHQLNDTVSGLMVKLDEAMGELGENAALALELGSALDRRGLRSV